MILTLIEMRMDDLLQMTLRDRDKDMLTCMEDWVGNIWDMKNRGYAYTLCHKDDVVACVGVTKITTGVAEVWAITGELVDKFPKDFHKLCQNIIEKAFVEGKLHRLQCTAEVDYDRTIKWLERLGFEREATLQNYTPDAKDMYLYTIIRLPEGEK